MNLRCIAASCAVLFALMLVSTGCDLRGPKIKPPPPTETSTKATDPAINQNEDGWLFDDAPNEKNHLRVKIDPAKKEVRVKVLDDTAKKVFPIADETITLTITNGKPIPIELKAQREPDQTKTSIFVGSNERLAVKVDPNKVQVQVGKVMFKLDKDHNEK